MPLGRRQRNELLERKDGREDHVFILGCYSRDPRYLERGGGQPKTYTPRPKTRQGHAWLEMVVGVPPRGEGQWELANADFLVDVRSRVE